MTQPNKPRKASPFDRDADPRPIYALITRARATLRRSWVVTGLALTVAFCAATSLAASALDIAYPLSQSLRGVALGAVVALTAYAFLAGVLAPAFRRLTKTQVARRIERALPNIHNRLVSCIDLGENGCSHEHSPAFFRRLIAEVLSWIRDFDPRAIVDKKSVRRAKLWAVAAVLLLGALLGFYPRTLGTALARIFLPSSEITPYTGVTFSVLPGDTQVLAGDPITFTAYVQSGQPDAMRLRVQSDEDDEPRWYGMQEEVPGTWSVKLTGIQHSTAYRVHGGGTWSPVYRVTLLERPRIENVSATVFYPEYMDLPGPHPNPPDVRDVRGPEGGEVEIQVEVAGDASEGDLLLLRPRHALAADPRERIWFDGSFPETARAEQWLWNRYPFGWPLLPVSETETETDEPPPAGQSPEEVHMPPLPPSHSVLLFHGDEAGLPLKAGDCLFAYVYVPRGAVPPTLMLQWNGGESWEHRAFWGEDVIQMGQPHTASRRPMGPLPPPGRWVRLEVPASQVGLEGKILRGMMFTHLGAPVHWGRAGAFQPNAPEPEANVLASKIPMQQSETGQWTARFPLAGEGHYRVEMRNALDNANKPMREAKYTASPDNPPDVVLEQPEDDLVIGGPTTIPLVASVYDDFALHSVRLEVDLYGGADPQPLKTYDVPPRSDTVLGTFDMDGLFIEEGGQLSCAVVVRDKAGQEKRSREFKVRIGTERRADDRLLSQFEKSQDAFQENLLKLIVNTSGVQREFEKIAVKYESLADAWDARDALPAKDGEMSELEPETLEQLESLSRELEQLAPQVDDNAKLAEQVDALMTKAMKQTDGLQMLPEPVVAVMEALQRAYQDTALSKATEMSELLEQTGQQNEAAMPDLEALMSISEDMLDELDSLQSQVKSIQDSRAAMWTNLDEALADIEGQVFERQMDLTEREIQELQAYLDEVRSDFDTLKDQQQKLMEAAAEPEGADLAKLEEEQAKLEEQAEPRLDAARELLDTEALMEELRAMREPEFPEAPYTPETSEYYVPPAEEDTEEPEEEPEEHAPEEKANPEEAVLEELPVEKEPEEVEEDDEQPLYLPALGGRRAVLDPRFAETRRPVEKEQAANGAGGESGKPEEELKSRQERLLEELDMADESLTADAMSLQGLIAQLRQTREASPLSNSPMATAQLLRSDALLQALAMSGRMRALQGRPPAPLPSAVSPAPGQAGAPPQAYDNPQWGLLLRQADAEGVDTKTRRIILRMQPKEREEILQAMREECPEGYQEFVRNYFRRLARLKPAE